MNHKPLVVILAAAALAGCDEPSQSSAPPSTPEVEASTTVIPDETIKISVFRDGSVKIDGLEMELEAAVARIGQVNAAETKALYYRESGQEEPHPNAMSILKAVTDARLPVMLSTEPDFSTVVGPDGQPKPRN
jgi:biopolymer transport protein ExbD